MNLSRAAVDRRLRLTADQFHVPGFITGRNEVVAKVIFLHLSVILFTGGGLPGRTPPVRENPPPGRTPPTRENPPARENPPCQGEPPLSGRTPPGTRLPLPGRTTLGPDPFPRPDPPVRENNPPRTKPPWDQTPQDQTPPARENNPPGTRSPPLGKQTAAYDQRAAGTHPTGMHSCRYIISHTHTRARARTHAHAHTCC